MAQLAFCSACRKQVFVPTENCIHCGAEPGQPEEIGATKYLLPVGRSGWAIAAGYLGLFSLLVLPAPLALLCGILALRDIAKHPKKIGKPRAIFGIVMGAIGTLILLAIFLRH